METTQKMLDDLTYKVLGCAIEVHKELGPGLLESVYEKCFIKELQLNDLKISTQQQIPIKYKGLSLEGIFRYDVMVEDLIIVELKAMEGIFPIHEAVILTYMKLLEKPKGIIINFNCTNIFKFGQQTFVNELYAQLPKE